MTFERISECACFRLSADDQLVEALAEIPSLERTDITFDPELAKISDAAVEKLLTQCNHLGLTDGFNTFVAGKSLYEKKYKAFFEKIQATEEEQSAEDILAN
jgi:hypothetical protein